MSTKCRLSLNINQFAYLCPYLSCGALASRVHRIKTVSSFIRSSWSLSSRVPPALPVPMKGRGRSHSSNITPVPSNAFSNASRAPFVRSTLGSETSTVPPPTKSRLHATAKASTVSLSYKTSLAKITSPEYADVLSSSHQSSIAPLTFVNLLQAIGRQRLRRRVPRCWC